MEEFIVVAKDHHCLESIYNDLETPGGTLYVPDRCVECCKRKPISRSTHYMMTEDEAMALLNDERVEGIDCQADLDAHIKVPFYEQQSDYFDKGASDNSLHINWGLLRCTEGQNRYAWGADGIPTQSGIATVTHTGRNVDVVIVDEIIDPNDPEFAVNSDGTGGSRVVQYNWFQHNPEVTGGAAGTYDYSLIPGDNHGNHVAGTVAGNTQGWARSANIYNFSPFGGDGVNNTNPDPSGGETFEYVLAFHRNKPVNPATGKKNPTIVNNSWGSITRSHRTPQSETDPTKFDFIDYRGTTIEGPLTDAQLEQYGVMDFTSSGGELGAGTVTMGAFSSSGSAAINDCLSEGILMFSSAGNSKYKIDNSGGPEVNNSYGGYRFFFGQNRYRIGAPYHIGNFVANTGTVIVVGASNSAVVDAKRSFSDCGPRVNVYGPGTNIQSSGLFSGEPDPRNSNYKRLKLNGTSMSCPQVTGVIACLLEKYPEMKQGAGQSGYDGPKVSGSNDVQDYINEYWSKDQLLDTGGSYTDENSLQGGPNVYLKFHREREYSGQMTPNHKMWFVRPSNGNVWPRKPPTRYER